MGRRASLIVLLLYLAGAATDTAARINGAVRSGERLGPPVIAVSFCAGLFWPIDIVARQLL